MRVCACAWDGRKGSHVVINYTLIKRMMNKILIAIFCALFLFIF